ncbi:MAG: class C sortase [Oscillospiraceae bacterium]|nr:class C sortase [Oscillospiraceae bacterium]
MKKKVIIVGSVVLFALIVISVLLYPTVAGRVNSSRQTRAVARYIDEVAAIDDGSRQAILDAAQAYNKALPRSDSRFRPTPEESAAYHQLLNAGLGVMGILSIDKLAVKLPIYHGTDEGVLQIGLGHLQGSSLPVGGTGTHALITGHRGLPSSTLLTNLDKMEEGDTFVLYVMGETLTYQVNQITVVEPEEARALAIDPNMDYCTLITCTPYGINSHRMLVRGHRVENAASAGWDTAYAEASRPDKLIVLLMLMAPALPVMLVSLALKCKRIHKKRGVPL